MEYPVIEYPGQMTPEAENETNEINSELINFKLKYNNNILEFSLFDVDNQKLKLMAKENDYKESELKKYETLLELKQLKDVHKYFRMFDNYNEFKNNFIQLCNPNNIKINNHNYSTIEIEIDLKLISNNLLTITLNKIQVDEKEQIKFIIKKLNEKNTLIIDLNLKIKEFEKDLNLKENKITDLEKTIKNLKIKDLEREKEIREIKRILNDISNNKSTQKDLNNNNNKNCNNILINTKEDKKNEDDKKIDEIMDYLDTKYYICTWLGDDVVRKKIRELKYNIKDIDKWIENLI